MCIVVFERSPFSRFTGKHTRFVLRASTHILTARYRFVIIIGADKRRPFVETYRSFKTRPFSKWTTFRSTAWKHTDSSRLDRYLDISTAISRIVSALLRRSRAFQPAVARDLFSSSYRGYAIVANFYGQDFFSTRFPISCLLHYGFSIRSWFFFNQNLL